MDSKRESADDFFGLFEAEISESVTLSARDLARISIEASGGNHNLRKQTKSNGALRFTGNGIEGHQGDAAGLFRAGIAFVNLVAAVGSGIEGARTRISDHAKRLTKLNLDASPEPGSVIFNLVPAIEPESELRPDGEAIDVGTQLVDRAIERVQELMYLRGLRTGDALQASLSTLGPESARALKGFVATAVDVNLDVDFSWREPLKPERQWKLTSGDSSYLLGIINGRNLDETSVQLQGILKAVAAANTWVLVDDEYGTVAVNIEAIKGAPWRDFNPEDRVIVDAVMNTREAPGKPTTRSFKAQRISKVLDSH